MLKDCIVITARLGLVLVGRGVWLMLTRNRKNSLGYYSKFLVSEDGRGVVGEYDIFGVPSGFVRLLHSLLCYTFCIDFYYKPKILRL